MLYLHETNSELFKDLKVRSEIIKPLQGNTGKKLLDIHLGDDFLTLTPEVRAAKARINKWHSFKLKDFFGNPKETIKMKRHPME